MNRVDKALVILTILTIALSLCLKVRAESNLPPIHKSYSVSLFTDKNIESLEEEIKTFENKIQKVQQKINENCEEIINLQNSELKSVFHQNGNRISLSNYPQRNVQINIKKNMSQVQNLRIENALLIKEIDIYQKQIKDKAKQKQLLENRLIG
ncbi:MAG: hypothetical protein AB1782_03155 [Cyanobacteriota bacterium]